MNVYDFDRTIFPKDSPIQFWKFCMKRHPTLIRVFPRATVAMIRYKRQKCSWESVTQTFFGFLKYLPNAEAEVEAFWDAREHMIYDWFLEQKQDTDLVISASPRFLVGPICRRLGISFIATDMDIRTGEIRGGQYNGQKKVEKYKEAFGDTPIDSFYSDSYVDFPMARLAREAYLVDEDGNRHPWDFDHPELSPSKHR